MLRYIDLEAKDTVIFERSKKTFATMALVSSDAVGQVVYIQGPKAFGQVVHLGTSSALVEVFKGVRTKKTTTKGPTEYEEFLEYEEFRAALGMNRQLKEKAPWELVSEDQDFFLTFR